MKSFKEYTDRNNKVSWLDWEGMSHAELRNKVKKKVSWLNIPNFDELRNKRKQENIKEESDITWENNPKISGTFTLHKTYGEKINKHGEKYQDENTKFLPQSPYAISKCAAHYAVRLFREAYNISYTDVYDFSSKKQSLKKFQK
jgi:hypothetical protein